MRLRALGMDPTEPFEGARSDARIYCAHMQDPPAPVRAPVLEVADPQALERTLNAMHDGTISRIDPGGLGSTAGFPRVFPVPGIVTFATGYRWNNP